MEKRGWWAVGLFFPLVTFLIAGEVFFLMLLSASATNTNRADNFTFGKLPALATFQYSTKAPQISHYVIAGDARPLLLRKYLEYYHSPLAPYASYIFNTSQKMGLDYRLLVAIAQQESNLCKKAPPQSYNCWGWGIYGHKVTRFHSYPEAIQAVARGLKKDYLDKGLTSPEEIMARYTPPSKGSWAFGVNQFMKELATGQWH